MTLTKQRPAPSGPARSKIEREYVGKLEEFCESERGEIVRFLHASSRRTRRVAVAFSMKMANESLGLMADNGA